MSAATGDRLHPCFGGTRACLCCVIPVSQGGSDEEANLVLLCANCHEIADYLSGTNVGTPPIRTRDELKRHLILLTTDPEGWEAKQQAWSRQAQDALSRMLAERHGE